MCFAFMGAVGGGPGAQGAARALRGAGAGRGSRRAEARPREHEVFHLFACWDLTDSVLVPEFCSVPRSGGASAACSRFRFAISARIR